MKTPLLPDHWKEFVNKHTLEGKEIEFPWPGEDDLTAMIEILNDETVEMEANELWPGIGIKKDGFIPVAGCACGTGDQYCINVNDEPDGPLYIVDHEKVGSDGYDQNDAVKMMLAHYSDLLKFLAKED